MDDLTASRVREVLAEGDGFWRNCSGCLELEDGQNVRGYPHSPVFGCLVGSGCSECGGLGVVWDSTDYAEMADWMIKRDRTRKSIEDVLRDKLKVLDGRIFNFGEAADAILELDAAPAAETAD